MTHPDRVRTDFSARSSLETQSYEAQIGRTTSQWVEVMKVVRQFDYRYAQSDMISVQCCCNN